MGREKKAKDADMQLYPSVLVFQGDYEVRYGS